MTDKEKLEKIKEYVENVIENTKDNESHSEISGAYDTGKAWVASSILYMFYS